MSTQNPGPPRRPFQDQAPPAPFYQTPEFKRFVVLGGLVAVMGLGLFLMQMSRVHQAENQKLEAARKATQAFLPKAELTEAEKKAREATLYAKFEGALTDTDNGSPLVQQSSGFRKLLEIMIKYSPEEVDERAKLEFDYEAVMKDPDVMRGEFVRARGILWQLPSAVKLDQPVLGREDFYRAVMTDGENPFLVDLTERPPGLEEQAAYDIEGIFYRTVSYAGKDNSKQVQPLLIARNMRRVESASETGWRAWLSNNVFAILAGMAILVFGGRLVFSLFQRNRRPPARWDSAKAGSFQEMFDRQLRAAGKTPPPPQPTPPGKSDGH